MMTAHEAALTVVTQPLYSPTKRRQTMTLQAIAALNEMGKAGYTVAVDFDGTLCRSAYPEIGTPRRVILDMVRLLMKHGIKLILWTCREGEPLAAAISWCAEQGITFDAVNENTEALKARWNSNPRKVGADEFWDDKAVGV
jgi:hypothetical protein